MAEQERGNERAAPVRPSRKPSTAKRAAPAPEGLSATLYDADGEDRVVTLTAEVVAGLSPKHLLWVDLREPSVAALADAASLLGLEPATLRRLKTADRRPGLWNHKDYVHIDLRVAAPDRNARSALPLSVFAGQNFVVTMHSDKIPLLGNLWEQIQGETQIGKLESVAFVAAILDRHLASYLEALDEVGVKIGSLDTLALAATSGRDLVGELLQLRRELVRLHDDLTAHRELYAALARPDLYSVAESESSARFEALSGRFDRATDALEQAREMIVGSFELFMMMTAQRTNDTMKVLTLVSVVLLPSVVVAGVMGMNFKVGLFDRPELFWVVVGTMGTLALGALGLARAKRWL